jgi:hypothetical protein
MKSPKLEAVGCEQLLRNAHKTFVEGRRHWMNRKLWGFVQDMTLASRSFSSELCIELGWNPNCSATDPLPERKK